MRKMCATSSEQYSSALPTQLLFIIGDGRNVFAHGKQSLIDSIHVSFCRLFYRKCLILLQTAIASGIFPVYVILDNNVSGGKQSILDVRDASIDAVSGMLFFVGSFLIYHRLFIRSSNNAIVYAIVSIPILYSCFRLSTFARCCWRCITTMVLYDYRFVIHVHKVIICYCDFGGCCYFVIC